MQSRKRTALAEQDPVAAGFSVNNTIADWVRGYRFQVNVPDMMVVELGCHSPTSNSAPQILSLWDVNTRQELARVTTTPGPGWVWEPLTTPVQLTNGAQYIVTQTGVGTVPYYYSSGLPSSWYPSGDITYIQMDYTNGVTQPTFPTSTLINHQYGVVDFGYVRSTHRVIRNGTFIPEKGTDQPSGVTTISPATVTYTLENSSTSDIPVTAINLSNSVNVTATVTSAPALIPASNTTTFDIDLQVQVPGPWSVDVEIVTTNSQPTSYPFTIEGSAQPQIQVRYNGTPMSVGSPVILPNVPARTLQEVSFEVTNVGTAPLDILSTLNAVADAGVFLSGPTVVQGASISQIMPGDFETVTVSYNADTGTYGIKVPIDSNDPNAPTYDARLFGSARPRPDMVVLHDGTELTSPLQHTDSVRALGFERTIRFTIRNDGDADLLFSGTPEPFVVTIQEGGFLHDIVTAALEGDVTVLEPGNALDLEITYAPVTIGAFSLLVEFEHNDPTQGPFEIEISGVSNALASGSSCGVPAGRTAVPPLLAVLAALLGLALLRRRLASRRSGANAAACLSARSAGAVPALARPTC